MILEFFVFGLLSSFNSLWAGIVAARLPIGRHVCNTPKGGLQFYLLKQDKANISRIIVKLI